MQPAIKTKSQILLKPVKPGPCITVITSFNPKMCVKSNLAKQLKEAMQIVEQKLLEHYPAFTANLMVKKFKALIDSLDYATHRKSIALYVSAEIQKAYYLDFEVQEKILISESFEIKDIILNKLKDKKYLLLTIDQKKVSLLIGYVDQLNVLITNSYNNIEDVSANCPDLQHEKETSTKKLILHIDNTLNIIVKAYSIPLFLAGTKDTIEHFRQLSKHTDYIVEYLDCDDTGAEEQLKILVEPCLKNWRRIKEKYLLLQLLRARKNGKCSTGIQDVYKKIMRKTGNLLVIDYNYTFPAIVTEAGQLKVFAKPIHKDFIYKDESIDEMIEKVLENGGDVEFLSDELLENYGHIALIQVPVCC